MTKALVHLGDLAVRGGGSVNPKKHPDEVFQLFSIPAFDAGSAEIVTGSEIGSSKKVVQPNDVMLSRIVPHIRRAWVVGPERGHRQIASGEWIVFRSAKILPAYLRWVLVGDVFHAAFMQTVSGVGGSLLRARPAEVFKIQIPLPSLPAQKRIAAILDAADALRAKRRESIEQLDSLVQATFLEMFGDCNRPPASIGPPSFGSKTGFAPLSQVATLATGHTPDRAREDYWGGSIPWISLTDIRALDGQVAFNTLQNVTESGLANSSSVLLPKGTVCFSRTASIGFVTVMGREMATSQDFVNWVCGPKINPIYLMAALRQSRPYLLSKSAGSTHKTIYYRHAEEMQVYLPPLPLQARFASIVESIEQQKARLKAHLAELDTLFASLQSRAFNGELVA